MSRITMVTVDGAAGTWKRLLLEAVDTASGPADGCIRQRVMEVLDGSTCRAYLGSDALTAVAAELAAGGANAAISTLDVVQYVPGASTGRRASFHYVVETDVLAEAEADFNAWYATEHLPGLAAVPGTVEAFRMKNASGVPRYFACYDLVSADALGSPAWLAVRATRWSSRVRPAFRNTVRTMFRLIEA
ncbi:MAG: hypothetical protein M3Z31_08105 [Pseudomonadota bacterium]|nr:hypothetical protein [Pseudomonadota bacterium]